MDSKRAVVYLMCRDEHRRVKQHFIEYAEKHNVTEIPLEAILEYSDKMITDLEETLNEDPVGAALLILKKGKEEGGTGPKPITGFTS